MARISKSNCLSCHKPTVKLIDPSFHDVATKYAPTVDNYTLLSEKIIKGGSVVEIGTSGYVSTFQFTSC